MQLSNRFIAATVALACVVGISTFVFAQGMDDSLIYSCVNASSGTIKIVSPGTVCANNEIPLNWNANSASNTGLVSYYTVHTPTIIGGTQSEQITMGVATCNQGDSVVAGGHTIEFRPEPFSFTDVETIKNYPSDDRSWTVHIWNSAAKTYYLQVWARCASFAP